MVLFTGHWLASVQTLAQGKGAAVASPTPLHLSFEPIAQAEQRLHASRIERVTFRLFEFKGASHAHKDGQPGDTEGYPGAREERVKVASLIVHKSTHSP
jgi:hypothetical protein